MAVIYNDQLTRDSSCFSVYFAIWAAYCRGTEDLCTEATVSVAPGSLFRGGRS